MCERELAWLDMAINFKKSFGIRMTDLLIRIGPRWVRNRPHYSLTEMRYLGIYSVQSRKLKCSLEAAKRGY